MSDHTPERVRKVRLIGHGLFNPGASLEVANGENVVILMRGSWADTSMLRPDEARKLASILLWQADAAESHPPKVVDAVAEHGQGATPRV